MIQAGIIATDFRTALLRDTSINLSPFWIVSQYHIDFENIIFSLFLYKTETSLASYLYGPGRGHFFLLTTTLARITTKICAYKEETQSNSSVSKRS